MLLASSVAWQLMRQGGNKSSVGENRKPSFGYIVQPAPIFELRLREDLADRRRCIHAHPPDPTEVAENRTSWVVLRQSWRRAHGQPQDPLSV